MQKHVVDFIDQHIDEAPAPLALSHAKRVEFDISVVSQLLHLYHKASHKLPFWVQNRCALTSKSYEQCTSENVANFKASLFTGKRCLDITAGLGVDSIAFSRKFNQVIAIEQNLELHQILAFNLRRLKIENVTPILGSAEDFDTLIDGKYDLIYVDPDRRSISGKRQILMESHSPNVATLYPKLFEYTNNILVKLSPMMDISYIINTLPGCAKIWVISERNEVKEVLVFMQKNALSCTVIAVDIEDKINWKTFGGSALDTSTYANEKDDYPYLFEPGKSVIKAGYSSTYASSIGLFTLNAETHYYLGKTYVEGVMGRWFTIKAKYPVHWKNLRKELLSSGINQISVAKRNFPESTETIRKRLKMPDGGNWMLLFTTLHTDEKVCFLVKRVKD